MSGAGGWVLAALLVLAVVRLRRRLELVALATHELRGPAMAMTLAAATLRREPGGRRRALAFEAELERMRSGLADLEAARGGGRVLPRPAAVPLERLLRGTAAGWRPAATAAGRRLRVRWDAGPIVIRADRGRIAQALGNLVANALEHGSGPVELRGARSAGAVRVEVRDAGPGAPAGGLRRGGSEPGRGRGLAIAARAVEEAGGSLTVERSPEGTVAAVELPLARGPDGAPPLPPAAKR